MKGKILFKEEQSFVGTWLWYLVVGIMILSIAGAMISYMRSPSEDGIIGLAIAILVMGGVVILLSFSKLYISLDQENIYYRYPPFVNKEKTLTQEQVKEIYVRKYSPIWEYGGWGYRVRPGKGKALNVAGNHGLQLVLSNGKRLLLGTQKPESLEHAVRRLKENWEMNG